MGKFSSVGRLIAPIDPLTSKVAEKAPAPIRTVMDPGEQARKVLGRRMGATVMDPLQLNPKTTEELQQPQKPRTVLNDQSTQSEKLGG